MSIKLAVTGADLARCYPVMAELRPHLSEPEFTAQVKRQMQDGYRLAYVESAGEVAAVAGFRFGENLAWGRFLYVDDLVTAGAHRSHGHGKRIFDWLTALAKENNCGQLHLDSGVQRFRAHKFYLREDMVISSHHFALALEQ